MRIRWVAIAFIMAIANAAEPPHPLMGATRDQVLTRLGEPKSQIVLGNQSVWLYARERIVLRGDVVVEVEQYGADAPRRPSSAEPAPGAEPSSPVPADPSQPVAETPVAAPPTGTGSKVEIKLVRPPSANYTRPPLTKQEGSPAGVAPPMVLFTPPESAGAEASKKGTTPEAVEPKAKVEVVPAPSGPSAADLARAEKLAAEAAAKEMKAKAIAVGRRRLADASATEPQDSGVSSQVLIAAFVLVAGGVGFFIWRWRQRQLELAATSVVNTPVGSSATPPQMPRNRGTGFSEEYLAQVDPAQFEILVAAYFNKTGVVAVRAKAHPGAVTQIRISWKGEPKPFAGVLCLPHPTEPIDSNAFLPMLAELEADGIRRGHVVTTGDFTAAARQFAAEKQLTLVSSAVLLEKLNALPENARREIMQAVMTG